MTRLTGAICVLMLLVCAAPAAAGTRDKIIQDCADDGRLQGSYSKSDLRDARQNMPSDVAEYTDCADVLRRAELGDGGGSGTGAGGSGGSANPGVTAATGGGDGPLLTPETDEERQELARASSSAQPVEVGGRDVVPGSAGLSPEPKRNGLPGTLVSVLVLLALATLATAAPALRRRGLPALSGLLGRRS